MFKNVANQKVGFKLISATDGSDVPGATVTVNVCLDGTWGAASGTVSEPTSGEYVFAAAQADTNADEVEYAFSASGAITAERSFSTFDPANTKVDLIDAPNSTAVAAIQSGLATPTNITAGTITTVTDLTNAPPDSAGVTTLLSRLPAAFFAGITSLAQWLGMIAGKQTGDSTARTEMRATGAGSGTFDETTDSQEALRDRGDAAWATATDVNASSIGGSTQSGGVDIPAQITDGTHGLAALHTQILNIRNNTFISHDIPQVLEKPDSSSETQPLHILFTDDTGAAADIDASGVPTVTLTQKDGTSVVSRLGSWTRVSTGLYTSNYTNSASDSVERLIGYITATVNSVARAMPFEIQIVDTTAVSFTSTDRTNLGAIKSKTDNLPASPASTTNITAASGVSLTSAYDASKTAAQASVLGTPTGASIAADIANVITHGDANWEGSGGGLGTGARTVTITVNDGSAALQNASVRMTNGAATYVGLTDVSGQIVFALDDATWAVAITKFGYTFTPTTLVVGADLSHTYSMTALSITPSAAGQTTGYLVCYDQHGAAEEGVAVSVQARSPLPTDTGRAVSGAVVTMTSDITGLVQFTGMQAGITYDVWRTDTSKTASIRIADSPTTTTALPSVIGAP